MSNFTKDYNYMPYLVEKKGIVKEANEEFLKLSGFLKKELLNDSFLTVWSKLLRISISTNFTNTKQETFLFTKSLEAKRVIIEKFQCSDSDEIKYYMREIANSRFEDKNQFLERLLTDNIIGIGVFTVPDLVLIKANQNYLDNFPKPFNIKEGFYGKGLKEVILNFEGSHAEKEWNYSITNNKSLLFEEKQELILNEYNRYWDYKLIPISIEGEVKYIVQILDDVTERVMSREHIRKKSETIEQQKEELEAIIDNIAEELYIIDKERNYLKLNKAARERYKFFKFSNSNEYIQKYRVCDLLENEIDINNTPTARLSRGECVRDETIIVYDPYKRYICVNAQPVFDKQGNFILGILLSQDVTTRVLQEQKIKYKNDQLKAIINSMSDGLEFVDDKMQIKFLNQSAKDLIYKSDEKTKAGDSLKYSKYYYGVDGEEIPREDLPPFKVFNEGSFQNYIVTIDRPDKKIYTSVNGSPIYDNDGIAKEAILCIRDITEQVRQDKEIKYHQEIALKAEMEKREALEKAIEMKDEFLSIMSHEFRTPLNVINAAIQTMNYVCRDELPDRAKKYINTIKQNTLRQLRLVNNLLDITRADAGRIKVHKRNIDLVFLTKSIVESVYAYASQKEVIVTFISSVKKKIIGIDDEKYERIILNLLSNAIKFTPKGKSITVKLRTVKDNISIEVKDTGIGIPVNKIDTIFERFGQVDSSLSRQAEGAGIGLSLVKKLVEALGGSISVKSKENKGSIFTIMLPKGKVLEEHDEGTMSDLLDNRLVQVTTVEFSDIYL